MATTHRDTKELGGEIGQLVRLIEDHRIGRTKEIPEPVFFERKIREQQVVIHDHQIRALRLAPRRHHMTAAVVAAALAETVLARGGDLGPQRLPFGETRHLGQIPRRRGRGPCLEAREQRVALDDALERPLRKLAFQSIST